MTVCGAIDPTFRLLDDRVGWDVAEGVGLDGATLDDGVLRLTDPLGPALPPGVLPAWLAWSGTLRTWWLATECGVAALGPCDDVFVPWHRTGRPVVAVAAWRRVVAVASGRVVELIDAPTGASLGDYEHGVDISAVGIAPDGSLLVADADGTIVRTDLSGLPCGGFTIEGAPIAIAFGCDAGCSTLVVHSKGVKIVPTPDDDVGIDLTGCGHGGAVEVGPGGFCIDDRGCFDRCGRPADRDDVMGHPTAPTRRGQYLSAPLDSGIDRCRWHRVRVDAELPAGTSIDVAVATTDGPVDGRVPAPAVPGPWDTYPPGDPDPTDWQSLGENVADALLLLPPGRHAYVRIRLTSTSPASPTVHQVRLDLPRATTADLLPAVYAADPLAHDFTERFLAIFDAHVDELDDVLDGRDALLDPAALPDDALTWLAGLLGTGFEAVMTPDQRRALISRLPDLYRRRGTPGGLVELVKIALDADITVEELSLRGPGARSATHISDRCACSAGRAHEYASARRSSAARRSRCAVTRTTTRACRGRAASGSMSSAGSIGRPSSASCAARSPPTSSPSSATSRTASA